MSFTYTKDDHGLANQGPKCVNESVHNVCECKSSQSRWMKVLKESYQQTGYE